MDRQHSYGVVNLPTQPTTNPEPVSLHYLFLLTLSMQYMHYFVKMFGISIVIQFEYDLVILSEVGSTSRPPRT